MGEGGISGQDRDEMSQGGSDPPDPPFLKIRPGGSAPAAPFLKMSPGVTTPPTPLSSLTHQGES